MATTHTYSKATDFGGNLDTAQLHSEIDLSAIVTIISGINTNGDVVDIVFQSPLSGGDVTLLNGLVTAHVPVAIEGDFVNTNCYVYSTGVVNLYDETSPFDVPMNVDEILDEGFTHAADSAEIKIADIGTYRVDYKITTQSYISTSAGKFWLEKKPDAGSWTVIPHSEGFYESTDPEQTTVTSSVLVGVSANDSIKMVVQGLGGNDNFIMVPNDSSIVITRV